MNSEEHKIAHYYISIVNQESQECHSTVNSESYHRNISKKIMLNWLYAIVCIIQLFYSQNLAPLCNYNRTEFNAALAVS
jgi:hypothetical protein